MQQYTGHVMALKSGAAVTTTRLMAPSSPIKALNSADRDCEKELHTNSVYVQNGLTGGIHGWKRKG